MTQRRTRSQRLHLPLLGTLLSTLVSACSAVSDPSADESKDQPTAFGETGQALRFTPERSKHVARLLREGQFLPTGARLTPLAVPGSTSLTLNPHQEAAPQFVADHPMTTALSPDGDTLLVLTTGYNRWNTESGRLGYEYVFVYDVSSPTPIESQVLTIANSFTGMTWSPTGHEFYVTGGVDDTLIVFSQNAGVWAQTATIALGHTVGEGLNVAPAAGGLSVNASGTRALVANYENDSVTLVDLVNRGVLAELDLRPGKLDPSRSGQPGGTFPFAVAFRGDDTAYVSSQRDDEVIVVGVEADELKLLTRIAVGSDPQKMILDRQQHRLFVANAASDTVSIISTRTHRVLETVHTTAPSSLTAGGKAPFGANPTALSLSPDEQTLYVTNGGTNSVSVIQLGSRRAGAPRKSQVIGLLPTGWYPTAVSVSADGAWLYVTNSKSVPGPNLDACRDTLSTESGSLDECNAANQYVWQLEKGGLLAMPVPRASALARLSQQVAENNDFPAVEDHARERALVRRVGRTIEHVIYIIKENRTYDQVLGDLEVGDGDPNLALFPEDISPNHHELARRFVTLDRFFDSGETSGVGWNWTLAARTTDAVEKTQPPNYAGRGFSYDWEGTNRNINVGIGDLAARIAANPYTPNDPDVLAGTTDVASPDVDSDDDVAAYLWEAAQRKGLSVRNYGCFGDLSLYFVDPADAAYIAPDVNPRLTGNVQFYPAKRSLLDVTSPYFRGYDMNYPDLYRYQEWEREFDEYVRRGELPNLQLVRLPHDHLGSFSTAIDGVNTPETQMADNDYAVGLLVEKIANSPFAGNTVVFVVEDDAQNGPDHIDAHRSIALVAGPYVKQGAVISKPYTTVNLVRTIEDLLGLDPMGITDAYAAPMADIFDPSPWARHWSFKAEVPDVLRTTTLPLPPEDSGVAANTYQRPSQNAAYWTKVMAGQNFAREDALDTERFNRALWQGLRGSAVEYPTRRSRQSNPR